MDRRLILAVAGSGKTTYLINNLNLEHSFLIVTYTENNVMNIRRAIIRKFGYEPNNIKLLSYFQFLFRVCYRPFSKDILKARGVFWKMPDPKTLRLNRNNLLFYLTKGGYLYHNRIAKYCQMHNSNLIRARIEKYYDYIFFDEIQDLGGHDFNLILDIMPRSKDFLFVGDFFQHTFETSNDGNVNKGLYNNLENYLKKWRDIEVTIDTTTLSKSYRCSPIVCDFLRTNLNVQMDSHRIDTTNVVVVKNQSDADLLYYDNQKVKLFYRESNKYDCYGINWGASKGLDDFEDVCIVLNATTLKAYNISNLCSLADSTRNKLYVACTRAKGNVYFISHKFIDKYKVR